VTYQSITTRAIYDSERIPPFTPGVNRVHFHSAFHGFMAAGVEHRANSSAEINPGTTWGPPRRHAPHGAYTTPTPATRDGVTARRNPTPTVLEPVHRGRKDRQADGTARAPPTANGGGESDAVSGAVQGDTVSLRGYRIRHTVSRRLTYRARTGVHPRGGILPHWCRTARHQTCGRGNRAVHGAEDVILR